MPAHTTKRDQPLGDSQLDSPRAQANNPASARPSNPLPPWAIVLLWIALSTAVILFNRELLVGSAHFPYPITLTTLHLLYQTVATRLLHRYTDLVAPPVSSGRYTLLPMSEKGGEAISPDLVEEDRRKAKAASVEMDWSSWRNQIVPPAVMFSISLVLSNWVYLYLTTAFIHMLKAFAPVAILGAAFLFGTKAYSTKLVLIVLLISSGVGLASYGETNFNLTGFLLQFTAIITEATRVTLIQILLQGKEMSPLKTLYYFAPICLALNASLILPVEGFAAVRSIPNLGLFTMLANCTLNFMLTLCAVYLIGLSSMVLSLSKVVKDILLVGGSAIFIGDRLTMVQGFGYLLATVGLLWYKTSPN